MMAPPLVVAGAQVADRVVADGVPGGALGVDLVFEVARC